ncbi:MULTISPECIES: NAD(P)/FAD-dependent oxidoreductase [Catenuloplanes]|uniref:NADH dehydrogenase FAD-containing subunit n=1 Tax=Catenuloplanes niger TaxID=587534 RepID=A0AAE4CQ51_9ACTN|nr:FAD-dependent oxidoreductase [Catenuloplanes niger]MDR7320142.1 NADH dehydrogenase FAD-containing subunit [Catenuloplanes niger]
MKHRIVVLGAGYAGVHAAGRLARRLHPDDLSITLVNDAEDFVERVRLHQLAAGQRLRGRPLRDVLAGTRVTPVTARVTAIDPDAGTVTLAGHHDLRFDTLVYALGSTGGDGGVPGVAEHAFGVAGRPAALRLRDRLRTLGPGAAVLVVGGGLTGIEAVTEIAESWPDLRVALVARGRAGDRLGDRARAHLHRALARLGVTVHEHTAVTRVGADGVHTGAGHLPAAVTVWTAGFAAHPIAAASTLEVTDGRIVVDGTMRSVSHPAVYAVGDAAIAGGADGVPLRMACAAGIPMAWQAADAIAARLTGTRVVQRPIRFYAQCISLGRRDGIIQFVDAHDRATPTVLLGAPAARVKEFVCAGAAWSVAHPTLPAPVRRRHVTTEPAAPAPATR